MKSKWKFNLESLKDYVIGENNKIYRKPYNENKRYYTWHEVKIQPPKRYRLNGNWWSIKQLKKHVVLELNPVIIISEEPECPF